MPHVKWISCCRSNPAASPCTNGAMQGIQRYDTRLAVVEHRGVNLSEWMVDRKLAVPYDGGTKAVGFDWVKHSHVDVVIRK